LVSKAANLFEQVERLKNLTTINVEEASAVLTNIGELVKPTSDENTEGDGYSNGTALPSELEIAGESLMVKQLGASDILHNV